jgi:hypothetical protein
MVQAALISTESERFNGLTIGKVSKVYPEANMVDIVMYDGSILKQVQVMTPNASSRGGVSGLPVSKYEADMLDRNKRPLSLNNAKVTESDVFAVLGFIGGSIVAPFVLGFLFPENCEILCGIDQKGNEDGTQFIWKHESNVYVRVAKGYTGADGSTDPITPDIEINHPSGLFIKIGRNTTLEPITNWDKEIRPFKKLNPASNEADPAPYIHISHPSGDYITIDPDGNLIEYLVKDVTRTILGDVTETIDGNYTRIIKKDLSDTVDGAGTNYTKGTWLRKSDTQIEDKCGVIHHNK